MKKLMRLLFSVLFFSGFLVNSASAEITTETYRNPDIRNDCCGADIYFLWCKCGFHGEYCEEIGASESGANSHVQDSFSEWSSQQRQKFESACVDNSLLGVDAILEGDSCTRCSGEHFRINYQGEIRCATNEEMCGTEDPFLVWDIGNNECVCTPGTEMGDSGKCEKEKIAEIDISWDSEGPPFLADGIQGGVATVVVTALKGEQEPIPAEIALAVSSRGTLDVDSVETTAYLTYLSPNLMAEDPSKRYGDYIVIDYEAKNTQGEMEKRSESILIPLYIGIPVEISSFGFETKKEDIQFRGGTAHFKVDGRYEDTVFSLPDATIAVKGGDEFVTDEEGEAEVETPNEKLTGETDDVNIELPLDADVAKILAGAKKKYSETGIQNATVATFLDDFPAMLANGGDKKNRQKLIDGLKRTEYALFFVKEGQKFANVSAQSLGVVTKDAAINVYDMLDTITGATGKISEWINEKGANVGSRAKEIIMEKLSDARVIAMQQMSAAFQAGVAQYAPKAGVWVGGLFKNLEDKMLGDTAKSGYAEAPLEKWIAEYFVTENKKKGAEQMAIIASVIESREFASLEFSSDLERTKESYVTMADNYLKAEEGEHFSTMTKATIDLGFDVIGKGISILTPYGKFVEGAEKLYKVGRTAFLDAPTMYSWYATHGEILTTTEQNIRTAMNLPRYAELPATRSGGFFPTASAEDTEDHLGEYMMAEADAAFYSNWAEGAVALSELFPNEKDELLEYAKGLEEKANIEKETADSFREKVVAQIPEENREEWGTNIILESSEPTTEEAEAEKTPEQVVPEPQSSNQEDSTSTWIILGVVFFGILIFGFKRYRSQKKR